MRNIIDQTRTPNVPHINRSFRRLLPLAIVLIVAALGYVFLRDVLTFETLAAHRHWLESVRDSHYALTALLFILAYAIIVSFSLPGATLASLTGGFLFGLWFGVVFNVIAATLGASVIFLAAKTSLGDRLANRMDHSQGRLHRIKAELDQDQWSILFVIRLVPLIPFFVANLLPALVGVPLHRFVISTFFGIMPGAFVITSVGSGLGAILDAGQTPDLGVFLEPQVLLPLLGLAALSLLPVVLRHLKKGLS